jgi:hypothetical protein
MTCENCGKSRQGKITRYYNDELGGRSICSACWSVRMNCEHEYHEEEQQDGEDGNTYAVEHCRHCCHRVVVGLVKFGDEISRDDWSDEMWRRNDHQGEVKSVLDDPNSPELNSDDTHKTEVESRVVRSSSLSRCKMADVHLPDGMECPTCGCTNNHGKNW